MNATVYRLMLHARYGAPLVFDDTDRYAVIRALAAALGERLLAYCLLDERLDVVAEGPESDLRGRMDRAMRDYVRERVWRLALHDPGLPARVETIHLPDSLTLALAIDEVHDLPTRWS